MRAVLRVAGPSAAPAVRGSWAPTPRDSPSPFDLKKIRRAGGLVQLPGNIIIVIAIAMVIAIVIAICLNISGRANIRPRHVFNMGKLGL